MHWTVSTQHKDFFQENHNIIFDDLLNEESLIALKEDLRHYIQKLGATAFAQAGKDICSNIASLNKFCFNKQWAKIFGELSMQKNIRFGFTQIFYPHNNSKLNSFKESKEPKPQTLQEVSSIQGVLGGVLIPLQESSHEELVKPGSALFFDKDYLLPFDLFSKDSEGAFIMIVYCEKNSVYIHNPNDEQTIFFRTFGYNFGDRLVDKINPLVYQSHTHN
jgi:hypothetical protein